MKIQSIYIAIFFLAVTIAFTACKKKPAPVPEEQELITTMKLLVSDTSGYSQTFIYRVENGFGTTTSGTVQIDTVKLEVGKTYTVTAELYNEKASPAENITEQVLDEQNAHLFVYQSEPVTGAGSITFSNGSKDHNSLPFNQVITFTAGNAGSGKLQVNLLHEPTDKNGATPAASGGETDAEAVYPVKIQ
jgi:hypothetical protein